MADNSIFKHNLHEQYLKTQIHIETQAQDELFSSQPNTKITKHYRRGTLIFKMSI